MTSRLTPALTAVCVSTLLLPAVAAPAAQAKGNDDRVEIRKHGDDPAGSEAGDDRVLRQQNDDRVSRQRGDRAEVRRAGNCTANSSSKLKAKHDDGGLEVEFEVDANRAGQRWGYRLWRDGARFAKGVRVTAGRSGSFSVERRTGDGPGRDVISAKAKNPRTGEICRASLVI